MLIIEYPKCSTCKKAIKFLKDNNIKFEDRNIVLNRPREEELKKWIKQSGKDIKKFFNTSGMKYKELGLKDKLPTMSEDEQLELLVSDGMLIKRPLLIMDDNVLIGFREKEWSEIL